MFARTKKKLHAENVYLTNLVKEEYEYKSCSFRLSIQ